MFNSCPSHSKIQRGPTHSYLLSLSQHLPPYILHMSTMLTLLSVLLLSSHVLPLVQSLNCNERTEYKENNKCCKKCNPGQYMTKRCRPELSDTQCSMCPNGYFTDEYNILYKTCNPCTMCTREYMKYEKNCTLTHDAVCTCHDGYICSNSKCQTCVEVQTTTPAPCSNSKFQTCVDVQTTTPGLIEPPPTTDNVWISVSLCFACVCVCILFTCLLLISRHARPCKQIMPASTGFWSPQNDSQSSQCTEEEEVPLPVQEVCGIAEKLEEV